MKSLSEDDALNWITSHGIHLDQNEPFGAWRWRGKTHIAWLIEMPPDPVSRRIYCYPLSKHLLKQRCLMVLRDSAPDFREYLTLWSRASVDVNAAENLINFPGTAFVPGVDEEVFRLADRMENSLAFGWYADVFTRKNDIIIHFGDELIQVHSDHAWALAQGQNLFSSLWQIQS